MNVYEYTCVWNMHISSHSAVFIEHKYVKEKNKLRKKRRAKYFIIKGGRKSAVLTLMSTVRRVVLHRYSLHQIRLVHCAHVEHNLHSTLLHFTFSVLSMIFILSPFHWHSLLLVQVCEASATIVRVCVCVSSAMQYKWTWLQCSMPWIHFFTFDFLSFNKLRQFATERSTRTRIYMFVEWQRNEDEKTKSKWNFSPRQNRMHISGMYVANHAHQSTDVESF